MQEAVQTTVMSFKQNHLAYTKAVRFILEVYELENTESPSLQGLHNSQNVLF